MLKQHLLSKKGVVITWGRVDDPGVVLTWGRVDDPGVVLTWGLVGDALTRGVVSAKIYGKIQ